MKKRMILLFVASLLVSACSEVDTRSYDDVSFTMPLIYYSKEGRVKDVDYTYSDRFFYRPSSSFDKKLAVVSLGLSDYISYPEKAIEAFDWIGYKNVYSSDYDVNSTVEDHISYSFAYKVMNEVDAVICVAVRGFDYGNEWASNFHIGESGNHKGFDVASSTVLAGLDKYVMDNSDELSSKNIKLWIHGFSRAGGTAGLLASKIIDRIDDNKSPFAIAKNNVYCYTFEAPNNLDINNNKSYPNIHNIINPNDLIPMLPPTKYGFKRAGVEHLLDVSNIGGDVYAFDDSLVYQEFKEKQLSLSLKNLGYIDVKESNHNHAEFNQSFIDMLTAPCEDGKYIDISTREKYCENFEFGLSYMVRLFFSKGPFDGGPMFLKFFDDNMFDLAMALLTGRLSGLYNAFKQTFIEFEVEFDSDALMYACSELENLLSYVIHDIGNLYNEKAIAFTTLAYNSDLLIQMHSPEFIMALLNGTIL